MNLTQPTPPLSPAAEETVPCERAAFLHERLAPGSDAPGSAERRAAAEARAARWEAAMLADAGTFRERLALAGLDREALVRLLAAENVQLRSGAAADACGWLGFLESVRTGEHGHDPLPPLPVDGRWSAFPFMRFLDPFLRYGLARLRRGTEEIRERRCLASDPAGEAVVAQLAGALVPRLGRMCMQTLTLELNVARVLGQLSGDTPEERFRSFSEERLARTDVVLSILQEYAVLSRLMVAAVDRWADAGVEFLDRLEADRPRLGGRFRGGEELGALVGVSAGVSDPHRGGRSVVHAEFACGLRLVYKPTSLAVDRRFQELVRAVNALGLRHPHRTIAVEDRGEYGWLEFVEAAGCGSTDEVRRFYWRQGSHLALLHLLKAVDFHFENLIAAGEHPVLVDLEALFHHDLPDAPGATALHEAMRLLRRSVLRLALLPALTRERDGRVSADLSALGGQAGQVASTSALDLTQVGTDRMHVVQGVAVTQAARNLPSLDGAPVEMADFVEEIVQGFEETYAVLADHREPLAAELRGFAGDPVRNLLRMTQHYGLFLQEGHHPDYLRDALDRDELLDRLWAEARVRPALRRVVPSEAADLRFSDVPAFTARPGERHLWDSRGECIPDFFPRPSLDEVLEQLGGMCAAERERQVLLIRTAVASVAAPRPFAHLADEAPGAPADLLHAAVAIGEYLASVAVGGEDDSTWIALNVEPEGEQRQSARLALSTAQPHLYEGLAGIALFLAYLSRATGRADFRELAERALRSLRADLRHPGAAGSAMLGAFLGHGSYQYLLLHLAALWNRPELLEEALADLAAAEPLIAEDRDLDLIGGAAGCVVVALHLFRATRDPRALRTATLCGEHLLRNARDMGDGGAAWDIASAQDPLPGFSHGAAGIGWALLELAGATGDGRFREAALRGIAWERRTFDPRGGPWYHQRVAWCHGAPSIGLGRVLSARHLDDTRCEAEIRTGFDALLAQGPMDDPCLCHGTLGNADLLVLSAEALGRGPEARAVALRWGAGVARQVEELARRGTLPGYVRSPGLMCGVAGLGLGLLRLVRPEDVPSVLCLAPPPLPSSGQRAPSETTSTGGTQ